MGSDWHTHILSSGVNFKATWEAGCLGVFLVVFHFYSTQKEPVGDSTGLDLGLQFQSAGPFSLQG